MTVKLVEESTYSIGKCLLNHLYEEPDSPTTDTGEFKRDLAWRSHAAGPTIVCLIIVVGLFWAGVPLFYPTLLLIASMIFWMWWDKYYMSGYEKRRTEQFRAYHSLWETELAKLRTGHPNIGKDTVFILNLTDEEVRLLRAAKFEVMSDADIIVKNGHLHVMNVLKQFIEEISKRSPQTEDDKKLLEYFRKELANVSTKFYSRTLHFTPTQK